eukprot:scaffold6701_cov181-Amphora_coffeaeformis.AAC.5
MLSVGKLSEEIEQAYASYRRSGDKNAFSDRFMELLSRVEESLITEINHLEKLCMDLLDEVNMASMAGTASVDYTKLLSSAVSLSKLGKALSERIQQSASVFAGMARKVDQDGRSSLWPTLVQQFGDTPWAQKALSSAVLILSDVFEALSGLEDASAGKTQWVAPDAFERSTNKYWVDEANLSELLFTCVGEAPLLVYGKT